MTIGGRSDLSVGRSSALYQQFDETAACSIYIEIAISGSKSLVREAERQIDQIVQGCYEEKATSSTRDCVMAGIRLGQRIRKQVKLSENKTGEPTNTAPALPCNTASRTGKHQ